MEVIVNDTGPVVSLRTSFLALTVVIQLMPHTHLIPPLRCAIGQTSQHVIAASFPGWGFILDTAPNWTQG